ncbi:MAG: pyridoxamine kinase [Eubacteriales bacterium]|nr:pyridoxamine kinase [Eubacteriales bacterium]
MKKQKRLLAVHDISAVGKCSLTVALPILSAAGIEVSVLPTAVLSTHTGGFTGYTFHDLTAQIRPMMAHWASLGIEFDAIYTGYLGSFDQLRLMHELFDGFARPQTLLAVDPVMADNGALYACFSPDFPAGMADLCARAQLITPNMTEAALLLGRPYRPGPCTKEHVEDTLRALAALGPHSVVLTGIHLDARTMGAAALDSQGCVRYAFSPQVDGVFYGTGDVFASALLGGVLRGLPLGDALDIAVDFVYQGVRVTKQAGTDLRYGINFESNLPGYIRALQQSDAPAQEETHG